MKLPYLILITFIISICTISCGSFRNSDCGLTNINEEAAIIAHQSFAK